MGVPKDKSGKEPREVIREYKVFKAAEEASEALRVETQNYYQAHRTPQAITKASKLLDLFVEFRLLEHAKREERQLSWLSKQHMYGDRSGQEWPVQKVMPVLAWSDYFFGLTHDGQWLYVRHGRNFKALEPIEIVFPATSEYLIRTLMFGGAQGHDYLDGSMMSTDARHALWNILDGFQRFHGRYVDEQYLRLYELERTFQLAKSFTNIANIPFWDGKEPR